MEYNKVFFFQRPGDLFTIICLLQPSKVAGNCWYRSIMLYVNNTTINKPLKIFEVKSILLVDGRKTFLKK